MAAELWTQLSTEWRRSLGYFDSLAIYERTQGSRDGLMLLLLRQGTPVAFVKLRYNAEETLRRECQVLGKVHASRPRSFSVSEPLAFNNLANWYYFAMAALPARIHRAPVHPPLDRILEDIGFALSGLTRPDDVPEHWRPMHGDFTPWNLRQLSNGRVVLYDWEDAGWGPPGADEVLFRATEAALRRRTADLRAPAEAVQFWADRIRQRAASNKRDLRLAAALRNVLLQMENNVQV